jgi:hypothetical protein
MQVYTQQIYDLDDYYFQQVHKLNKLLCIYRFNKLSPFLYLDVKDKFTYPWILKGINAYFYDLTEKIIHIISFLSF